MYDSNCLPCLLNNDGRGTEFCSFPFMPSSCLSSRLVCSWTNMLVWDAHPMDTSASTKSVDKCGKSGCYKGVNYASLRSPYCGKCPMQSKSEGDICKDTQDRRYQRAGKTSFQIYLHNQSEYPIQNWGRMALTLCAAAWTSSSLFPSLHLLSDRHGTKLR